MLTVLLLACIGRLWLMPLGSSFWLDETFTAFLVHNGSSHPSLAVAPQVVASIYYFLPRASEALFGFSEVSYRLPSVTAMAIATMLIARLAARLVHPRAGWFAAFACFGLSGINYQAADARPYALGIAVAAASFLFLVRWLDSARRTDALLFVLFGGLLWRVHLIYWPLYLVFALYAVVRIARSETRVRWLHAIAAFVLLAIVLLPVLLNALAILRQAGAHAFAPLPLYGELLNSFKLGLVAVCGVGSWLLNHWRRGEAENRKPPEATSYRRSSWSSLVLIGGWWLLHPLCLFAYSRLSSNSLFLYRYLSISLAGAVLAATAAAGLFMRSARWNWMALLLGAGVLLTMGQWRERWPAHDVSDWRGAAHQLNELDLSPATPVICPSPFLEARPPEWRPDYPLPGYLYAHFDPYPIPGKPVLFPFESSPEAVQYATTLVEGTLPAAHRFVIYGWDVNVRFWRDWFQHRPELVGWHQTTFNQYGDVWVVLFERGADAVPDSGR